MEFQRSVMNSPELNKITLKSISHDENKIRN